MNPETLLNQAAEAIEKRPITCGRHYHIAIVDEKIVCVSSAQPIPQNRIIATFNGEEIEKGLTTKQWDELSRDIITFYEKEAIKCLDQKH